MTHSINAAAAWPEAKTSPKSRTSQKLVLAALAVGAAVATTFVVPAPSFRAKALVSVADVGSPLAMILPRNAAEASVSKPVMTRAAESLIGTGFAAPEPDIAERVALAAHLRSIKATGKVARLAADLPRRVVARPGEMPGTLDVVASSEDAERAAQIASSVADALIAGQDDAIAAARRKREADSALRLERLKGEAAAARRQLALLGGEEADPTQALSAAVAQTAKAKARVETIRAIVASGSPPLSDRRDVPSAIETLQSAYLDLTRQLAKARETLGERHTTIIALHAELRHASASLTAEWRRLARMAESEWTAARDREVRLRSADTGGGTARRETIEEARRKVQFTDDAVARALSTIREPAADEHGYRLIMRPVVPNAAEGLSLAPRLLLAGLAGLLVLGLALLVARARRSGHAAVRIVSRQSENVVPLRAKASADDTSTQEHIDRLSLSEDGRGHEDRQPSLDEQVAKPGPEDTADLDASLMRTMTDLLPRLDDIVPAFGAVPTVMVAANEITAETTPAALALGRAAAGRGLRVLLVEATRSRPELATAAEADADPILVDFFGTLRVALRATTSDGSLFLAPNLQRGARIASALAREGGTPLVDDIGAEFDLVLIDGGRSTDAASAGWGADAYVRVARQRSARDDVQFASAFEAKPEQLFETIVADAFSQAPSEPVPPAARPVAPVGRPVQRAAAGVSGPSPVRHAPPRRRIAAR